MGKKARLITIDGESMTLDELTKRFGISKMTIYRRLKRGLTSKGLSAKPYAIDYCGQRGRPGTKIKVDGQEKTIGEWSKETGVAVGTIRERLRHGWEPEKAVATPVHSDMLTIKGKTKTKSDWARYIGITRAAFHYRLSSGNTSPKNLLRKPTERRGLNAPYGKTKDTIANYLSTVCCAEAKTISEKLGLNRVNVSRVLTSNPDLFVIDHTVKNGKAKVNVWRLKQ